MQIQSDQDFVELRKQFGVWRKRFPMFTHDVNQIERMIEDHIQKYSIIMVHYRQTKSKSWLEKAQLEINTINQVVATVEKIELMSMLSRG